MRTKNPGMTTLVHRHDCFKITQIDWLTDCWSLIFCLQVYNISFRKIFSVKEKAIILLKAVKSQTFGIGVSSTFGCIPMDVVFARIMPSSGLKFSRSARDKACPPTVSASSLARSWIKQRKEISYHQVEIWGKLSTTNKEEKR